MRGHRQLHYWIAPTNAGKREQIRHLCPGYKCSGMCRQELVRAIKELRRSFEDGIIGSLFETGRGY